MANPHITAAFRCSQFKKTTRLLLLVLADAASPGKPKGSDAKGLPAGYCKRKLQTLMMATNCHRQPTISASIKELCKAGAIKVHYKKRTSPLFFVDLDWLKDHAYTDEQLGEFEYDALREARAREQQAEEDELKREPLVSSGFGAGSPPLEFLSEYEDRLSSNENRLSSKTKSASEEYENRLTVPTSYPPVASLQGFVPPPSSGESVPIASQDKTLFTTEASPERSKSKAKTKALQIQVHDADELGDLPVYSAPSSPVHPASPPNVSAAPRNSPKPICKRLGCGGPLKPNGECKKCGASSKPDIAPVRVKAATAVGYGADGEEEYELCPKCGKGRSHWMFDDLCRRCYQQENP